MATFLPLNAGASGNLKPCAIAVSPMYCSTELIPTKSSTSFRLQPVWQGAGHTRPIIEGNGFAVVERRNAYSCMLMPTGGFSIPRTICNQPRISSPDGQEPWQGGVL